MTIASKKTLMSSQKKMPTDKSADRGEEVDESIKWVRDKIAGIVRKKSSVVYSHHAKFKASPLGGAAALWHRYGFFKPPRDQRTAENDAPCDRCTATTPKLYLLLEYPSQAKKWSASLSKNCGVARHFLGRPGRYFWI